MHLTPLVGSKVHYFDFCVTPLLVSNIDTSNHHDPAGGVKDESFPFINLTPPAGSSKSEESSFLPPILMPPLVGSNLAPLLPPPVGSYSAHFY